MGVKILTAVFLVDTLGFILKKKNKKKEEEEPHSHYLAH